MNFRLKELSKSRPTWIVKDGSVIVGDIVYILQSLSNRIISYDRAHVVGVGTKSEPVKVELEKDKMKYRDNKYDMTNKTKME